MKSFTYQIQSRSILIFLLFPGFLFAHEKLEEFSLFSTDEILEIELRTDFKSLIKNKNADEYLEGDMIVNDNTYRIRLKARDNNRDVCSFPAIVLNFSKTEFRDKSYDQLKELKLVNSCKMQQSYEQYILREYLIYRTFNLLTDKSLKVRLLKINYVDTKEKFESVTQYGFVVEDEYMMAKRLDGMLIKKIGVKDQSTNNEQIVLLSIFQFLMGNTNWQVPQLQNLILLKLNEATEATPYAIPYDFDHCGMVNASYSIPSPILGIKSLRERLYWGKCYSESELKNAIDKFLENKKSIYELYQNFDLFDQSSNNSCIDYLDSFYGIIEDEKKWKYEFIENCK